MNFVLTNGKSNFNLPITGGIGTAVFTIGGIMIMAGAVMLLTYAIRRSRR
ncbi:LPXTG cell wall anchor domain-containing protein [[Ruminococcus] torques]|nr:LPXTG cell wall anchor domain-containing protein [[Ruminococcus] torques]